MSVEGRNRWGNSWEYHIAACAGVPEEGKKATLQLGHASLYQMKKCSFRRGTLPIYSKINDDINFKGERKGVSLQEGDRGEKTKNLILVYDPLKPGCSKTMLTKC